MSLNLASRPFVNQRPVKRLTVTLWVVVAVLVLVNGALYIDYFRGSGRETRERHLELQTLIRAKEAEIATFEGELGRFNPGAQAEHVLYLNEMIGERTFGWSHLFDRLVDVLPRQVRLTVLSPQRQNRAARNQVVSGEVELSIQGFAAEDTALYEFIDALWAHDSFDNPQLANEHLKNPTDQTIAFKLQVAYDPDAKVTAPEAEDEDRQELGDAPKEEQVTESEPSEESDPTGDVDGSSVERDADSERGDS